MKSAQSSDSRDLPENWWKFKSTCEILSNLFNQHLLGLLISVEVENTPQNFVFTGFLLYYREILLWLTAGHVISKIEDLLKPDCSIITMQWLDGCTIPGAESVIVHNRNLKTFSTYQDNIDFGCVIVEGLDAANILKNDQVKIVTEQIWKNLHFANPEGYYIVGYPEEWVQIKQQHLSPNQMINSLQAQVACLPVEQIEHPGPDPDPFWGNPNAFYGKIVGFADDPASQPKSIRGMSGGPLLSIERDKNAQFRYYLFGIEHAWEKHQRIIRAESIQTILDIITFE